MNFQAIFDVILPLEVKLEVSSDSEIKLKVSTDEEYSFKVDTKFEQPTKSNVVTGSFVPTSSETTETFDIPYDGNGYPIAGIIWVDGGTNGKTFATQNIVMWYFYKTDANLVPTYDVTNVANQASSGVFYSTGVRFQPNGNSVAYIFNTTAPSSGYYYCVRIQSNTKFSIYLGTSSTTSYKFVRNITYRYCFIYSEA